MDCSSINNEKLSDYIIINEMVSTTGCTNEQAKKLLILTEWKLQVFYFENELKFFFFSID